MVKIIVPILMRMNFKTELIKNILFKGINVLLSFVVTVLIVRLLGAQGNGIYSLFMANTAIIVLVVGFSFNSGLTYYSAKNEFSPGALFNSAISAFTDPNAFNPGDRKTFSGYFWIFLLYRS